MADLNERIAGMKKKAEIDEDGEEKALSMAEKRALFEAYDKAEQECVAAQRSLEEAEMNRAGFVRDIALKMGNGPFEWKGRRLTPVCRVSKDTGKEVHFFRGGEPKVEKIG
jgi:hypothetical protein